MNLKALIPLIVGLGVAGVAAKLGLDFVRKADASQAKMVKLWTPVEDIKRGVAIDRAMLRPLAFPASAAPKGALADVEKLVGRVPHTGAPAGVPILGSMLLPAGARAGVRVPAGLRAVAVKVNESSGVDNHLEPGCRVDVVGLFTVRRNNRNETLARTVLENVEVAAVGQRLAPAAPAPGSAEGNKSSKRERPAQAVTLLVKPEEVPVLHLAEQRGKIKLSMRGVDDADRRGPAPMVDENDLLGFTEVEPAVEPMVEPTPLPAPAPSEGPQLAWVMRVYNGAECRVLGWANLDDFQPLELSTQGPNIFQDKPGQPLPPMGGQGLEPRQPVSGSEPGAGALPTGDTSGDSGADADSEPEELFE